MCFIAYAFKGQVPVFAGQMKIVSHWSCRTCTLTTIDAAPFCSVSCESVVFPGAIDPNQKRKMQIDLFSMIKVSQGSHTLEKYLNIQDCLEKSLKIKFTLKSS